MAVARSRVPGSAAPVEHLSARLCGVLWSLRREDRAELVRLEAELLGRLQAVEPTSHDHGALEAMVAVTAAARRRPSRSPLGVQTETFEPREPAPHSRRRGSS